MLLIEALTDAVIGGLVERWFSVLGPLPEREDQICVTTDPKSAASRLKEHLVFVERWSSEIAFRDLLRSKKLTRSFVDLECHLGYLPSLGRDENQEQTRLVSSLLGPREHAVILGRPGAGKTTSIQKLALTCLQRYRESGAAMPLVVRLRELTSEDTLLDRIMNLAGIDIHDPKQKLSGSKKRNPRDAKVRDLSRQLATTYLNSINALLFIDGLDECPQGLRGQIERDIRELMEYASTYRIVLTCRNSDYKTLFPAQTYTLLPLTPEQIRTFAHKWLGSEKANLFTSQLANSPYEGAGVIPITLAHLCAIYERRGEIPREPRFVYQKIVRLLLEEWDEQRSIRRRSQYSGFEVDRKLEFLRSIAYSLTVAGSRGSFSHAQLERAYLGLHERFDLPRSECSRVTREIESHNGLILQSSSEHYEFAHKSIQEYLTAEFLLRLPRVSDAHFVELREELAIATALSSAPDQYLESIAEILLGPKHVAHREQFSRVYLNRLLVERPSFGQAGWLGWTLLAIWDSAFAKETRAGRFAAADAALDLLFTHDSTARAVYAAVRPTYHGPGQYVGRWIVQPQDSRDVPKAVWSYVTSKVNPGVMLNETAHQLVRKPKWS